MKLLRAFILKETRHILRDVRTLAITILMPVALVILFGYVITNEIKHVQMAVYVPQSDTQTHLLTHRFTSSGYFDEVITLTSETEIPQCLQRGIKLVLVFPARFEQQLFSGGQTSLQLVLDGSDMNTSQTIVGYAENIISQYKEEFDRNNGLKTPRLFDLQIQMLYNPSLKSVYMFLPGVLALIMLIVSAMMTAISIAREKELNTLRLLLVSPLQPVVIIIGKVIPYMILSVINTLIIIGLSVLIFHIPITGSILLLTLLCFLFICTALSFGILIGLNVPNQQVAVMVSILSLYMPTLMLSGFVFPIENMPVFLQYLSNILPAKWFIIALRSILIRGTDFLSVWHEFTILFAMMMVFIGISVKRLKSGIL
ncbi:MAG: ABC transporter permease [Bacteroidales bacterium]